LRNIGFIVIHLSQVDHHEQENYIIWNPKQKHRIQSHSLILLEQTYREFHTLDKTQIASQIAANTDKNKQIFDADDDVIPKDEEGNYLPNKAQNQILTKNLKYQLIQQCLKATFMMNKIMRLERAFLQYTR
jgi:hypothetical protein